METFNIWLVGGVLVGLVGTLIFTRLKPLLITTAFAASASFLSPYGYQTNLMVYSPGKYRYLDYVRAGLPLSIVYGIAVCALVPWFFPF